MASDFGSSQLRMAISTITAHIEGLGEMIARRDTRIAELEQRVDTSYDATIEWIEAEAKRQSCHWLVVLHQHWRPSLRDTLIEVDSQRRLYPEGTPYSIELAQRAQIQERPRQSLVQQHHRSEEVPVADAAPNGSAPVPDVGGGGVQD